MGLTNRKEEQLRRMPIIETRISRSKDNKFVIHRTTITDIKSTAYLQAVLASSSDDTPMTDEELISFFEGEPRETAKSAD